MDKQGMINSMKAFGCKYFVRNDRGGLYGGFKTLEDAERCKAKAIKEYSDNPWENGTISIFIVEC